MVEEVVGVQHIIVVQVEMEGEAIMEEEEEDHLLFNVSNVVALIMHPLAQVTNRVIIMGVEVEGEVNEHLAIQIVVEDRVAFSVIIVAGLIMHQLARTRDKYSNIWNTKRLHQNHGYFILIASKALLYTLC